MARRLPALFGVLGLTLLVFGLSMLLPLGVALALDDAGQLAYDEAVLITLVTGALLWGLNRRSRHELKARDGFLLVVLVWTVLPLFAALPLLIALPGLSFTDAYFEAMSGLTTTGATVLTGLDGLPPSINLWRAQLHLMGGMGVIVLVVAVLPLLGVGGRQMLRAETPGPMKDVKLTPRMRDTARGLWLVYGLYTTACFLAFWALGMDGLDALIHAFSVMGLGGFSSHDASFAHFDSTALEITAMAFALLAGMNFATHFLAIHRRSLLPYRLDPELRPFLAVVLGSSLLLALYLWMQGVYADFFTALRYASFNTISMATTLGLANADFGAWPPFAGLWLLALGSFSTCAGSTGGGVKMMRAMVLYEQLRREMLRLLHPTLQAPVRLAAKTHVPNPVVFAVLTFLAVYAVTVAVFTLALVASGLDLITAYSATLACINNTGPGLGGVGPSTTYAGLTDLQTWLCTLAMLLGRLELITLLVVLTPAFWRK
ncbi:MAG: TrkH family potassium uptake protein [Thiobacillaceae bacterium]|nr:TrkH family potassium uptake protein [Thiobacillaceae bacterium]